LTRFQGTGQKVILRLYKRSSAPHNFSLSFLYFDKAKAKAKAKANMELPSEPPNPVAELFCKLWPRITSDDNLTLHGFRRFKTTHLLNLRFLEEEIAELDHVVY
jgi:hypothetical protein